MRRVIVIVLLSIAAAGAWWGYKDWKEHRPLQEIVLYGNVDVRQVDLGFRVGGKVTSLLVEEGDEVSPETLVAYLDSQPYEDLLKEAVANVESVKAALDNAEKILQRRRELIQDGSISQEDLDTAVSNRDMQVAALKSAEAALGVAENNLSYTQLSIPSEGTILTRIREPGSVVNVGEPVYTLSVRSPVWIRAFVSEPYLGLVYPGMEATISTDTPGGKTYKGKVGFISPVAEFTPKTVETTQLRTDLVYRLRIYADNPDKGLRQGMPVTVQLQLGNLNE